MAEYWSLRGSLDDAEMDAEDALRRALSAHALTWWVWGTHALPDTRSEVRRCLNALRRARYAALLERARYAERECVG